MTKQTLLRESGLEVSSLQTDHGLAVLIESSQPSGDYEIAPEWGEPETYLPTGEQHESLRKDLRRLSDAYRANWRRLFEPKGPLADWIWSPRLYAADKLMTLALDESSTPAGELLARAQGMTIAGFEPDLLAKTRYLPHSGMGQVLSNSSATGNSILKALRSLELLEGIEG